MHALVTGSGGFVGRHLVAHLEAAGDTVTGWTGAPDSPDITAPDTLRAALGDASIDVVYHLAGQSRVDLSWQEAATTMHVNAGGTANLIEALASTGRAARVLIMSSAEVYGFAESVPVLESSPRHPQTPYGISKSAAEDLSLLLGARLDVEIIICRPFNQIGPGQSPKFVASAFASQIAVNERAAPTREAELRVGNLSATRDFLDVRDAVAAYRALAVDGAPGEAYNVCAGVERSIDELLDGLLAHARVRHRVEVDPGRFRPNDLERMFGSPKKLIDATGWVPQRSFAATLGDVLDDWRARTVDET